MTTDTTPDANRHPSINADLIRQYFTIGDLDNLLTIFDHLRQCTLRAEALSRAYLDQMLTLQKRLDDEKTNLPEPRARKIVDAENPKPRPTKPPKGQVVDIDL